MNGAQLVLVICFVGASISSSFAGQTVFSNNKSVVATNNDGVSMAYPDVCLIPAPPPGVGAAGIPIPYPNAAVSGNGAKTTKKVKTTGKKVAVKKSEFSKASGDEAGVQKGLMASKNMDKSYFKIWSMDVKVEGRMVIRQFDMMSNNGSNANMPAGMQVAPSQTKVIPRSAPSNDELAESVTEVFYVAADGTETKLKETSLIELANGEYCAVCMANGNVTAIHRFVSIKPQKKSNQKIKKAQQPQAISR